VSMLAPRGNSSVPTAAMLKIAILLISALTLLNHHAATASSSASECDSARVRRSTPENVEREVLALIGRSHRPVLKHNKHGNDTKRNNSTPHRRASVLRYMKGIYAMKDSARSADTFTPNYDYMVTPGGDVVGGGHGTPLPADRKRNPDKLQITDDEKQLLAVSNEIISFQMIKKKFNNGGFKPSAYYQPYHFNMHKAQEAEMLLRAKFRVYKKVVNISGDTMKFPLIIKLFVGVKTDDGIIRPSEDPIATTLIMQDHQGWIVFNVTDAMQHWLLSSSNSKYFTLYVVVEDLIGKPIRPAAAKVLGRRAHEARQAFVVTFFQEEDNLARRSVQTRHLFRNKRQSGVEPPEDTESQQQQQQDEDHHVERRTADHRDAASTSSSSSSSPSSPSASSVVSSTSQAPTTKRRKKKRKKSNKTRYIRL